jgi:hypothetical protein
MEACSKALAVLTSDDAADLFTKTFNFVQKSNSMHSERRVEASKLLKSVGSKLHSPRLVALSMKVKLDAFTRVKKAIDDMVAELIKEKEDEIAHKDFCVAEFEKNELDTEAKDREKSAKIAKIEDLDTEIKDLTDAIDTLKAEVAELQLQLKHAGEDREKENKEFQATIADQRATQKILTKTLDILKGFYDKAALLQTHEPAGPPPPPGFDAYKKNEQSGGVMGMIQTIINDAKSMESECIRDEEDAQKAYEDFVKESNNSIELKSKEIVAKSEAKATAQTDDVQTTKEKEDALLELEMLSNYNAELHESCDFVMKNFEIRQTARDEEVVALNEAKAILSGAKFQEFLEMRR